MKRVVAIVLIGSLLIMPGTNVFGEENISMENNENLGNGQENVNNPDIPPVDKPTQPPVDKPTQPPVDKPTQPPVENGGTEIIDEEIALMELDVTAPVVYSNSESVLGAAYSFADNKYLSNESSELVLKEGDTVIIKNGEELNNFSAYINNGGASKGITWKLSTDISLSEYKSIGNSSYSFNGTFDGETHTVSLGGQSNDIVGLFGYVDNGEIKNVSVKAALTGNANVGGIVANAKNATKIENCKFEGSIHNSTTSSTNIYVGGIVGYAEGTATNEVLVRGCTFGGNIEGIYAVGGIAGMAKYASILDCADAKESSDKIKGKIYVGGIAGSAVNTKIAKSTNSANIETTAIIEGTAPKSACGGIVGNSISSSIEDATNTGQVVGAHYAGGIIGSGLRGSITKCINKAEVKGKANSCIGGIAGAFANDTATTTTSVGIYSSYNTGNIKDATYVGGIVGEIKDGKTPKTTSISACFNSGTITGIKGSFIGGLVGGIVGKNNGKVKYCYNTGELGSTGTNVILGGICGQNDGSIEYSYVKLKSIGGSSQYPITKDYEGGTSFFDKEVFDQGVSTLKGGLSTYDMISGPLMEEGEFGTTSDHWVFENKSYPQLIVFSDNEDAQAAVRAEDGVYISKQNKKFEYSGKLLTYGEDEDSDLRYIVVGGLDIQVTFEKKVGNDYVDTTIDDGAESPLGIPLYVGEYRMKVEEDDDKIHYAYFEITKAELLAGYFNLEIIGQSEDYTGNEVKKTDFMNSVYYVSIDDFEYSYENNIHPSNPLSKAKLTIKGKDRNFNTGSLEYEFDILIKVGNEFTLGEAGVFLIGEKGEMFVYGEDRTKYVGGNMFYLEAGKLYKFVAVEGDL